VSLALLILAGLGPTEGAARMGFEKTLEEFKAQGLKCNLTEFDFSTSPEMRAREDILKATARKPNGPFMEHPELMEPAGTNQAVVIWQQETIKRQTHSLPIAGNELSWDVFGEAMEQLGPQLDAAYGAIFSGPIQFNLNAPGGTGMLLPHLALLKNLTLSLNDQVIVALHGGDRNRAWTNLLAATRLVTQWNPEPVEISHRVRFADAKLVFKATWQALAADGWPDGQLAALQQEWESVDYFGGLPQVQAFRRAGELQAFEDEEASAQGNDNERDQANDKNLLLHFCRDREMEYRAAIKAKSWMQMRSMPGVTNELVFEPKSHPRTRMRMTSRRIQLSISGGSPLMMDAAEAEASRRVLITAIALERYRAKHKRAPEKLSELAPEFLQAVPTDFVTGESLRYRATDDGHFSLYSLGLDGVDNGGTLEAPMTPSERLARLRKPGPAPEYDIAWPRPSSSKSVIALRKTQAKERAELEARRDAEMQAQEKADAKRHEAAREAAMKKLLAAKPSLGKEPVHKGKPLSSWVDQVGGDEWLNDATQEAVEAIHAIGAKAVPFLLEWMPHPGAEEPVDGYPNSSNIESAWAVLGSVGKAAIPELARNLSRPQKRMKDYSAWTASAKAISYLGPEAIDPMLRAATNMQGDHLLWELLHNFENLETNGAPAIPALIHWANDPDYWVRDGVVSALGGIGKRPDLAVPVLLKAVRSDTNSMVRRDAAAALGSFANDSDEVLPELKKTLKDPDWEARGGALTGLGKLRTKPELAIPLIVPFLYDTNNVIQRSAAYALRDLGSEAGFKALQSASNAPSSWPGIGDIIYEVQEKRRKEKGK